jgi:hypothetical protein
MNLQSFSHSYKHVSLLYLRWIHPEQFPNLAIRVFKTPGEHEAVILWLPPSVSEFIRGTS